MAKSKTAVLDEDELELVEGVTAQPDPPKEDEEDDDEPVAEEPNAETGEVEPGEPASETVGEPDAETVGSGSGDVVSVPESVQPAPAGDAPEPEPVETRPEPKLSRDATRLAEIETKILAEDFDAYSIDGRKLQLEHNRLSAQVANEPLRASQFWTSESVAHSLPRNDLETIWGGITAQYLKDYPGVDPDYWQIAAKKDYDVAVSAKKGQRSPATPRPVASAPKVPIAAPTPITPKGARVAPPSAVVPPPPKPRSDEEELIESVRREHKSGVRI